MELVFRVCDWNIYNHYYFIKAAWKKVSWFYKPVELIQLSRNRFLLELNRIKPNRLQRGLNIIDYKGDNMTAGIKAKSWMLRLPFKDYRAVFI